MRATLNRIEKGLCIHINQIYYIKALTQQFIFLNELILHNCLLCIVWRFLFLIVFKTNL